MAIQFTDGMQVYSSGMFGEWTIDYGSVTDYGYTGYESRRGISSETDCRIYRDFSNLATVIYGFRYWFPLGYPSNTTLIHVKDGSTQKAVIQLTNTGVVNVQENDNDVVGTYTVGSEAVTRPVYVELKVEIAASGAFTLKIDEEVVASGTGDFFGSGNLYANRLYAHLYTSTSKPIVFQDVYVCSTAGGICDDFLGAVKHTLLVPDTDSSVAFTPSTGSDNYALVDNNPTNGDTDYNYANTAVTDELNFTSLTGTPTVYNMTTYIETKKEATGTDPVLHLHSYVKGSSATQEDGVQIDPTTSYAIYTDKHPTDPDTSALWDYADINAIDAGYYLNAAH